jgi:hypothetical protein
MTIGSLVATARATLLFLLLVRIILLLFAAVWLDMPLLLTVVARQVGMILLFSLASALNGRFRRCVER